MWGIPVSPRRRIVRSTIRVRHGEPLVGAHAGQLFAERDLWSDLR